MSSDERAPTASTRTGSQKRRGASSPQSSSLGPEKASSLGGKRRVDAAIDVAAAALGGGLTTIEGVHGAIARKPFAALRAAPVAGSVAEIVRIAHDGITRLVYAGIGAAISAAAGAARFAALFAQHADEEPRPGSLGGMAIAALNGFAGERLETEGNPLSTSMSIRVGVKAIPAEPAALLAAFPSASPRLAIFVHGLACNESLWHLDSRRHYENTHTTYGSRLEDDLGYTPVYLRYNTGLHIAENGRRLSRLLEDLVSAWPVPVEELVLVGHSMGGLVIRSAGHYGADAEWVGRLRHAFYLGSPHQGAPLEKAANLAAWLLDRLDITRPLAAVVNQRSAGIKDLRFGSLRHEDWESADIDALLGNRASDVPLLARAGHYFISATVTRDRRHPVGFAVGDLLVREASARPRRLQFSLDSGRHFGAMHHLQLLNHPDVYEQIRRWLAPA